MPAQNCTSSALEIAAEGFSIPSITWPPDTAGSETTSTSSASSSAGSPVPPKSEPEKCHRRNAALKFPPCVICDGKASGLHYGCNTCEACKNFFRRYLIRKNGYICPKQNDCHISNTNKSNCSACRLTICLDLGMCKTKSKLGRYSYSRRTETINKVKQIELNEEKNTSPLGNNISESDANAIKMLSPESGRIKKISGDTCTLYDEDLVNKLTKAMDDINIYDEELHNEEVRNAKFKEHYEKFNLKVNMFGSMNAVSMEEYKTLLKNYGIDIDGQYEACLRVAGIWEAIIDRYCDYAKKVPGFLRLSYNDQSNLLKATHCIAFMFLTHQFYSSEYNVFLEANGEAFHMNECADRIMSREYTDEVCRYCSYLQKLKLTKEEMALLVAISTFSSDFCKLENPELVESIQLDFVDLLSQYLKATLDKQAVSSRFIKLLDTLVRIRNLVDIYNQEMKQIKNDELLSKALPSFVDFFVIDD